jgi:nitroimidazol reductase NimA-like FMN-containing flavoprotein (pyridoxamine 5'-phosphate oxidase superfamily)
MPHDANARSRAENIGPVECWQLVAEKGVGRVGFMEDSRLRIVPTRYDAEGHTAYFRALTYGELALGGQDRAMSLQVDEVDLESFTGWSVLMSGQAHRVKDAATIASLWVLGRPHPWVSGTETQWIALVVDTIEGQRVAA